MLKIHDAANSGILHPFTLPDESWCITHAYNGRDILTLEMSAADEAYKKIAEEVRVEDDKNRYIIKNIDEHSGTVTVDCEVDLDDWKGRFWREYRSTGSYLADVLDAIKPDGWEISGAGAFTQKATVEASEGEPLKNVVALDILSVACEAYGAVVNYDALNKTLYVINPESFTDSGEYFTDELNLRSVGYTGNSTDFATRLYAYGKADDDGEPLTFADINEGKEYVDDHSYSDRVISIGWSDERYTVPENLLSAAKEKLKEIAYPIRSYECDVRNMDGDVWLYKMVTLVDRRRKIRIKHRVVEYKEYPKRHDLDVVTISAVVPRIENEIKQVRDDVQQQVQKQNSIIQQAVENATDRITGAKGGNILINYRDNKPYEILILDTDDVNTAQNVWRWNLGGLGHSKNGYQGPYDTAITADGKIVADFILAGILSGSLIRAGILEDQSGKNSWNLDTGELKTTQGEIGGWNINPKNLVSPSGNMVIDSQGAAIRTIRANGNKGVEFVDDGINLYSWADDGNYIGKIGTGYYADENRHVLMVQTDNGDVAYILSGSKYIAVADVASSEGRWDVGVTVGGDMRVLGLLRIGAVNLGDTNRFFATDNGMTIDAKTLFLPAKTKLGGYGIVRSNGNNQVHLEWTGSQLQLWIDNTYIGVVSTT